jgi:predicted transcriptional regulator of viral defense system
MLFLTIKRNKVRFIEFENHFQPFKTFSVNDIQKWNPAFDNRRLVEWQEKKYVEKIINRWYRFTDTQPDERFLFLVANRIYAPSYISLESGLAYYRLIPEAVYMITSATSLKTHTFKTPLASFSYRHIKPELFFGYKFIDVNGQLCKIAEPEKLLLDHLYLNTHLKTTQHLEAMRLNWTSLREIINEKKLQEYMSLFKNKRLEKRVNVLQKMLKNA